MLPDTVMVTARKGTFGHGMSAGGGWELTAQYLGYVTGHLFPTLLTEDSLNPAIAGIHGQYVFADSCVTAEGLAGKLSSGIGGVNASHERSGDFVEEFIAEAAANETAEAFVVYAGCFGDRGLEAHA